MEYNIKININEVIDNSSDNEKEELFKRMFFDIMDNKLSDRCFNWLLNDMMEAEIEFENRIKIVEAYKTLIKDIKKY